MNLGLRDAVTLGDALSGALREGREDRLDEYAAGSRAEAMHVVALAHRLTRLATAPAAVRPLRNVALRLLAHVPAFRRGLAEQLSALGHRRGRRRIVTAVLASRTSFTLDLALRALGLRLDSQPARAVGTEESTAVRIYAASINDPPATAE
jgi:hypothetical protein